MWLSTPKKWTFGFTLPLLSSSSSLRRTALPYGGYDKTSKLMTFEVPEFSIATEEPDSLPSLQADIRSRPSFNRTPIGWVCSEDNSHIHMDLDFPFDGETDDLWTCTQPETQVNVQASELINKQTNKQGESVMPLCIHLQHMHGGGEAPLNTCWKVFQLNGNKKKEILKWLVKN